MKSINQLGFYGVSLFVLVATLGPILAPFSPYEIISTDAVSLAPNLAGPHYLGTDDIGRDFLSRLLYGARMSLIIGLSVVLISMSLGVSLGIIAGFYTRRLGPVIMRLTDILMSLPSLLMAMVVVALLGPSVKNSILAVSLVSIPAYIRLLRAATLEERAKPYVEAGRSFGLSDFRLMVFHILPNCLPVIIVQGALGLSEAILSIAALGFLNLGAQAPIPEWGVMLSDGRAYMETSSWLVTLPGLCILFVVLSFNLFGDELQEKI